MVKDTQTIRWQFADELLSVFDHFVGLALKGVISLDSLRAQSCLLVAKENKNKNRVKVSAYVKLTPETRVPAISFYGDTEVHDINMNYVGMAK